MACKGSGVQSPQLQYWPLGPHRGGERLERNAPAPSGAEHSGANSRDRPRRCTVLTPGRATQLRSRHRDAQGRNEEAPSRRG
jgi:hypothetical protein